MGGLVTGSWIALAAPFQLWARMDPCLAFWGGEGASSVLAGGWGVLLRVEGVLLGGGVHWGMWGPPVPR